MRYLVLLFFVLSFQHFAVRPLLGGDSKPLTRIAFGSCAQQERAQPIWNDIVKTRPDIFLFIGDNIYADTEDMNVMKAKYAKLAGKPGFRKLRKLCPILATWDDHDYGVNDGGFEYPKRAESQKVFCDFFNIPKYDPRRTRPGVYHAATFGPAGKRVQIILLDTRYFRSKLKRRPRQFPGVGPYVADPSPKKTMLGEAQWKWLRQQLQTPAKLRIIASSVQVVAEDHGWEKWGNFPLERQRLFKLIRETKANGVIFISGDRHLAELSQMDAGVGYPIYDLTSSGLNQGFKRWRKQEKNRHRVATMNFGDNFGFITVDWEQKDPLVRLQIRDQAGEVTIQQKLPLSVLQRGTLPIGSVRAKLADGQLLTAAVIKKNLKKKITVLMKVRATGKSKDGRFVFLNSAPNFRDANNFTIVLKSAAQQAFHKSGIADPGNYFRNKRIRVTGVLSEYRGSPQIIVSDAKQVQIKKERR